MAGFLYERVFCLMIGTDIVITIILAFDGHGQYPHGSDPSIVALHITDEQLLCDN